VTTFRVGPDPDDVPRPVTLPRPSGHPNRQPQRSLLGGLSGVIDNARQLATDIGARPYRVFSVVVKWSGGDKGRGDPRVISELEFLPTPKTGTETLRSTLNSGGQADSGEIRVTEISPRYTEEEVHTMFHVQPLPKGHEGWIEVTLDTRGGTAAQRRRFELAAPPYFDAENLQWIAKLRSEQQNRTSAGMPRDVTVIVR
jgi:hypothetical protein